MGLFWREGAARKKGLALIHFGMGLAKMGVIGVPGIDERHGHRYGFSRTPWAPGKRMLVTALDLQVLNATRYALIFWRIHVKAITRTMDRIS